MFGFSSPCYYLMVGLVMFIFMLTIECHILFHTFIENLGIKNGREFLFQPFHAWYLPFGLTYVPIKDISVCIQVISSEDPQGLFHDS
jgi:hypothetical protein